MPKLKWMQKHEPQNYKKIARILLPKDFIKYKLSGVFSADVAVLLKQMRSVW